MNTYGKRALAAAVASLGAAALAPTASADTTLVLFEHDTVQHQVDLGGPGPGPGDQFIFAGDVFDRPGGVFLGTVAVAPRLPATTRQARRRATARSISLAARSYSRAWSTPQRCSSAAIRFHIR
jgi:hypothetical protein